MIAYTKCPKGEGNVLVRKEILRKRPKGGTMKTRTHAQGSQTGYLVLRALAPAGALFLVLLLVVALSTARAAGQEMVKVDSAGGQTAMTWNSFLGGSGNDAGQGMAVDANGNVYVVGTSYGTWPDPSQPAQPVRAHSGGGDAFVAKLDSSGTLIWNSFLGGDGLDEGAAIAVDTSGDVYVTGYSEATWQGTDAPVMPFEGGEGGHAFVAKLGSDGALIWNSFLGGASSFDYGRALAVDASGNVYVAGTSYATWSDPSQPANPVIAYSGGADAFAAKLDGKGNLIWNSFLGGAGEDEGYAIGTDADGNVYVAGTSDYTWGSPVRAHSGDGDAFAAKLNGSGILIWNSFLGGDGYDDGTAIAVGESGNVYVAGTSNTAWQGTNLPVRRHAPGSDHDAFAAALDASGNLTWNSFLGASGGDYGTAIAVDANNNVYVTGTSTANWGDPLGLVLGSGSYAFATKLDSGGSVTWNLFLGGAEGSVDGYAIAADTNGNVYVAGTSDSTWGSPIREHYPDPTGAFEHDAFVTKLPGNPPVELISFRATPREDHIELTWETGFEPDNAGFRLRRAGGQGRDYSTISSQLIAAKSIVIAGASYSFMDFDVLLGESYSYVLECVDTAGVSSFHWPVFAVMGTVMLVSPANGAARSLALFQWDSVPYNRFKLQFSRSADFSTRVLTLPASANQRASSNGEWITESFYTPTKAERKKIKRLAARRNGKVYWRVYGEDQDGNGFTPDANWLRLK